MFFKPKPLEHTPIDDEAEKEYCHSVIDITCQYLLKTGDRESVRQILTKLANNIDSYY